MLHEARESRDRESKSTAGDKHEVGRAMAQAEVDKYEQRLAQLQSQMQMVQAIPEERSVERVALGSLVKTDLAQYFIAVPFGALDLSEEKVYVISPVSPIGALLLDKALGDEIVFNGKTQCVEGIA